jgi:hypothetical protein
VATYINKSFSCEEVPISTSLQAVECIIRNIYSPGDDRININDLENLINQFDCPFFLLGDFNTKNVNWGSMNRNDKRGKEIEKFIENQNLNNLNNRNATHFSFSYKTFSAIDLTLSSPILQNFFDWYFEEDLYSSDHFPVILSQSNTTNNIYFGVKKKLGINKADWINYANDICLENTAFENINDFERYITSSRTNAAKENIPLKSNTLAKKCVPWWNDDIKKAITS